MIRSSCACLGPLTLLVSLLFATAARSAQLVDDRTITIRSAREVKQKREALIQYLWGKEGFPTSRLPNLVHTNVASPVKQLSHLDRVDEFRMDLAPGLQALSY